MIYGLFCTTNSGSDIKKHHPQSAKKCKFFLDNILRTFSRISLKLFFYCFIKNIDSENHPFQAFLPSKTLLDTLYIYKRKKTLHTIAISENSQASGRGGGSLKALLSFCVAVSQETTQPTISPLGFSGLSHDTRRVVMVISVKVRLEGGPGVPCRVRMLAAKDLGPSPAGLNAITKQNLMFNYSQTKTHKIILIPPPF